MLVLLAVVLLLALATGESVLYRMSHFLGLVIAVTYAWTRLSLWRLDMWVEEHTLTGQVGDMLEGFIYIRNNSALPSCWLEIMLASDMEGDSCGGATRLPAWGSEVWDVRRVCFARGVYTMGPLLAISRDPLGLFRAQIVRSEPITVVVYPPSVELPEFCLPVANWPGKEGVGYRFQSPSSQTGSVREYNHGDGMNRIHWRSTAKCGQLMSKELDPVRSGDVWILLDLEQQVHASKGVERTDEYAVAVAASVARTVLTQDRSVGLIAYGDREYVLPLGRGTRQMSRILEMLAWSRTEGSTPVAEVLSRNTPSLGPFASLAIITSSTSLEWVSVLQSLAFGCLSIVAVVVDPMSFGSERSCYQVSMRLVNSAIPVYTVQMGDYLPSTLSEPLTISDLPSFEQIREGELASSF